MTEAYAYCGIPPDQFWGYTPSELELMVEIRKIQMGVKEPAKMTNPEMELMAQAISETYANLPKKGVR